MGNLDKYKGIIPAFYACYDEEGNVSPERVRALTQYFIDKGVKGVYVNGSSGECIYQGVEERKIMNGSTDLWVWYWVFLSVHLFWVHLPRWQIPLAQYWPLLQLPELWFTSNTLYRQIRYLFGLTPLSLLQYP